MEDNKLIAEFMGRTDLLECNFEMDDRNKYYHNSWDWLMPVVQKCYKIDNEEGFNNLVDAISTLDIKATYKAVIEFIKVAEIKYNNEENHEMLQLKGVNYGYDITKE